MGAAGRQFLFTLAPPSLSLSLPLSWCLASLTACFSLSFYSWVRHSNLTVGWGFHNGNIIVWCCICYMLFSAYYCNYAMDKCIVGHAKVTASDAFGNARRQFLYTLSPPLSICGNRSACYPHSRDEIILSKRRLLQRYLWNKGVYIFMYVLWWFGFKLLNKLSMHHWVTNVEVYVVQLSGVKDFIISFKKYITCIGACVDCCIML